MKRMIKTFYVKLAIIFILMVSGCGRASAPVDLEKAPFASFKDIPGVTAQEIAAIETLRQKHAHFVYGMNYNTVEAFPVNAGQNGISDIGGYTARLCKWLTALFDIPFRPAFYDWNTLVSGLANHEIDFTGDLTLSDERKKTHFMTSTIAERTLSTFKIADKPSITEIAKSRSPRLVFVSGSAMLDYVKEVTDYAFEPVFAGTHAEAYRIIKSGDADAFLTMNIVEPDFDIYGDVIIETFYPLMFGSAALTTQNPDLKPVISVVQKALENGGVRHLAELYTLGQNDYIRNKFFESLEPEEREYIQNNPVVKVATETDYYPISFYSKSDKKLEGIAFDVMKELELITGLSFFVASPMNMNPRDLTNMVENGEASFFTVVMRSKEREKQFLLPETAIMKDFSVLISKSEFPNIKFSELSDVKVGIVRGTMQAGLFKQWFPHYTNYREYDNMDDAFNALEKGDVDMFMAMSNYLLSITNYKELVGYKANVSFGNTFDITFGFNSEEAVLFSIVDKALKLIDLENISDYWTRKTYDYRAKVAEGRLPWLIGAAVLALIILTMILRSRNIQRQKEADAQVHEADERTQLMLEQTPLVVMLWDKDANIIECNQEAVRVTGLSSKQEYMKRLFDLTPDLPDGTTSSQAAQKAIAYCLETGYIRIPWALHHAVTGELIPFDVTIAKVKYKGEDAAISYAQDVRERNAAIEKMREADDRARVMIEQAPLVVMLWDKDANIIDCNQEALGILGLSSKEEYMKRFFEIAPDQPNGMTSKAAAKMLIRKTLETGFEHVEWMLNHPETGEAIPFESTLARIKYKDEYVVMSYGQDVRERYSAIEKIREVEERAQLMIEQTPLVVMLWDKDFNILECNHEAVRIFGLQSKKEYIERFFELSQEYQPNGKKSIEAAHQALVKAFSDTGYARIEWTQRHAVTGELIPFDATLFRIKYKDEYAVLSYAQDLRELNAAIAKMRKADEKTKLMFDAMPLCSNFWTSDGVISDCNDEVVRLFDLKDKQEYIDRFPDLSPQYQPDGSPSGETAAALVGKAFKEGYCRFEWMMQKLNGEPVPTEVFLIRIKHQDDYIVVAYFRDLREMKDSISKIREADERAMLMIEQTPLVVMLWDKDANIIDCNQEAVRATGLSNKQEYMERVFELTPDLSDGTKAKDAAKKAIALCLETGYIRITWTLHHAVTGELIPFDCTLARVKYKGEDVVISYGQDVRERNAAIEKIREADERAMLMIEQTPLVVMLWDKDANIIDCNQEAVKVTGLSSKKEYMERLFEITPDMPDGTKAQDAAKQAVAYCLETGYIRIPWALHHAVTGELIPFDVTTAKVKYKGEDAVISYGQDMRERNAAIAKVQEADERAQLMIEQAPFVTMVWDEKLQILDCNQEAVRVFGLSSKQEYIERFIEFAPEFQPNGRSSVEMIQTEFTRVFKETGFYRSEWTMLHSVTGEAILFDVTLVRIKYKDGYAILSYAQDLRELKASIAKIREADERAQIMFDVAPYACCMYDKNGDMIDCNQEIVNMFGLKDKESYFKRASELSPEYQPDGELSSVKADRNGSLAIEKGIHRFEWLHRRLSGELFPAEITMVRVNYKGEYAVAGYIRDLTEQKAKENLTKEVMEKTSTLSAIFNTAPDLIFVKDLESRYIQCNKSFETLMGCKVDDIIGKDDAEGLNAPPEVAAAFVAEDKKIFDKKKMVSFEDHIIAADGSKVLFETVKSPLIVNGKMTGLVGVARDITKRKEMEKELLRHHALMDTVNAAAAVLLEPDTDGGINSINRSMEMVCQKMDVDRVYLWENVKKGNDELSFRQIHKWISPDYPLDSNLTEFSCGNLPYWNSQFSERKSINGPIDSFPEAEQEFLSQQEIQSILAVPLFFKEELWGFVSFDDCRKSHLFSKADEHTLSSWGLLVIGAIQRGKIMLDLEHAVSEAKRASSEAMKAYAQAEHALEAKSRFIANMNHEMRTPMNVIVGLTDLMMEEKGVPEKVKETLVKINIAGDTLMGLISDVLDISKAEAGKMDLIPVQYDVASMLNDVITLSTIRAEDKPITFKLDIHEDMFESLYGDELRVKQILNNLLSNAFKYTKKGEVTLGVSCQHDGEAVWLSFYVEDTGIGIRKEDIKKLFSDYSQVDTKANRKIDGTGLGLSITKKFVDIMDGEISVKSDYGRGTVFSARVRQGFVTDKVISKETVKSLSSLRYLDDKKKAQKKLERADLSYARVLVVDDFPTNLDVAAGMLRKYKMQVDCVMSGQESVDAIARGKPVYNAIFMDHMMPEMDGVEAVKLIRALKTDYAKNISIIALTANAVAESEKMFLENGFDAFLPKPFNTMSLDSVVQRWVRDKTKEG